MRFSEIDKKTKIFHIIECRGPLLFLQSIVLNIALFGSFISLSMNK